ncbi:hypothetical protein OOZ15_11155 [Galbibacter sp. EGI 63066]|uniref:hypothetical protein n=1 Tax=Galbibacter sp. EGI 63066 TaxID=2993559 RepID=UPI00224938F9|nr:hypothetical protein [Galbibacter sp. EGI 63066]MCX2680500.1 hypothetical protein [Galbibacter sp. EGI 63066]
MTTFNVSIPENKMSFFLEFLELIGAKYKIDETDFELTEEQKAFLIKQNDVPVEACTSAEEVYKNLKEKYVRP